MGAKNKVIAGDYLNGTISPVRALYGSICISLVFKKIPINKDTVEKYEVVDEKSQKSAISAIGRGFIGASLLGPVGLLAGLSAKSKGVHTIAIQFKDGKRSLIEVDDDIYKELIKKLF